MKTQEQLIVMGIENRNKFIENCNQLYSEGKGYFVDKEMYDKYMTEVSELYLQLRTIQNNMD